MYIVDLNTRVTGNFHLGPLAGHFVQRGLLEVSSIQRYFRTSRATFEDVFAREIRGGQRGDYWLGVRPIGLDKQGCNQYRWPQFLGGRGDMSEDKSLCRCGLTIQQLALSFGRQSNWELVRLSNVVCSLGFMN